MARKKDVRNRNNVRLRIQSLYAEQNGNCFYCGKPITIIKLERGVDDEYSSNEERASLDHIYDRNDIRRYLLPKSDIKYTVLAHQKCNNDRSVKRHKKLNISSRGLCEGPLQGMLVKLLLMGGNMVEYMEMVKREYPNMRHII